MRSPAASYESTDASALCIPFAHCKSVIIADDVAYFDSLDESASYESTDASAFCITFAHCKSIVIADDVAYFGSLDESDESPGACYV